MRARRPAPPLATARRLVAAPVVAALLAWQLVAAVRFEAGELASLAPGELARGARAPLEERLLAELGAYRHAVYRAVVDHVPETDRVAFVTPDFERDAHTLILWTGLIFPRWMLPAVREPGLDLGLVRPRGGWTLWLVDLDSGFGIPWERHCERVATGEGFTLWRLRAGGPEERDG